MKQILFGLLILALVNVSSYGQSKSSLDSIDYNLFKSYNVDFRSYVLNGTRNLNYLTKQQSLSNLFRVNIRQNSYSNLEKKQTSHFHSINLEYTTNSNSNNTIFFASSSKNEGRYYYTPNMFYEINYFGALNPSYSFKDVKLKPNVFNLYVQGSVEMRLGKGRINPIDEIFTAAFIVDEIKSEGIDIASFDQKTLFEFGQLLVLMRNRRILDSRRLKVRQFLELSKFIDGHISTDEESKAMVSAIIMDNLFFANNPSRFSGHRISFGINPSGTYTNRQILQNLSRLSIQSSINFDYNKVISRYFNFDAYSTIMGGKKTNNNSKSELIYAANTKLGLSYYPNSRTNMSTAIEFSKTEFETNLAFLGLFHYFINYNTYLDLSFNLDFLNEKSINYGVNIYHAIY